MPQSLAVAVIGARGRLGEAVVRGLRARGDEVVALNRQDLDLEAPEKIAETLAEVPFEVLLNTAALTDVDGCESRAEEAHRINALSPEEMAKVCAARGARFLHVSTDYVFSGDEEGLRQETEQVAPQGVYAQSKTDGEQRVLAVDPGFLVLRTSWLFGPDRPSFIDWIVSQAREKDRVEAVADKISVPTYSEDFVELLKPLLLGGGEAPGGVLHLCNDGSCSWQEFGQAALDHLVATGHALRTRTVDPVGLDTLNHFVAPRPRHTAMAVDKYERLIGRRPRPWREALSDYLDRQYPLETSPG